MGVRVAWCSGRVRACVAPRAPASARLSLPRRGRRRRSHAARARPKSCADVSQQLSLCDGVDAVLRSSISSSCLPTLAVEMRTSTRRTGNERARRGNGTHRPDLPLLPRRLVPSGLPRAVFFWCTFLTEISTRAVMPTSPILCCATANPFLLHSFCSDRVVASSARARAGGAVRLCAYFFFLAFPRLYSLLLPS